ncbi:alanine racemase [Microbacterium sp. AG1240]|uniref:alanine racemase n=1 Tax=Microbacterium sp. AG1240 TaxID=2183992 RepID=UPI0015FF85BD|nr:alanine racemase [Microbacterium sp. AG1240]
MRLDAIRENVGRFAELVSPAEVMAVVKADAYGHGAIAVARAALEGGASWLGVAHIAEALALRDAFIEAPLLAWLHTPHSPFEEAVARRVRLGISSREELDRAARAAVVTRRRATVHLKIDTGLGRNGSTPRGWHDLLVIAEQHERRGTIRVEGVFSHLSVAEDPARDTETDCQREAFDDAVAAAREHGFGVRVAHLANTAAALRRPDLHYDMVRVGIGTYGLSPLPSSAAAPFTLQPALSFRTVLSAIKVLPAGHGISYGARHTTSRPTRVGLVPVGYGDGLPRSARGMSVTIGGVAHPILGVIAMDQFVIGLDGEDESSRPQPPRVGDEVVVIAHEGVNSADAWAAAAGTINYEIVTRLGMRAHRSYS